MDDDFTDLEEELKRLRPVAPTPQFHARIRSELCRARAPVTVRWAAWTLAAAAIAVALILRHHGPSRAPGLVPAHVAIATAPSTHAEFQPVAARNVLIAARDDGLVTLTDGTPARRYREVYVDSITWKDPRTRASLTWTLPRQEIRVQPISYQ